MIALIIVIFICVLIAVVFSVIAYKSLFKHDEEFLDDAIVENYMPQFTGNFTEGALKEVILGPERKGFVILPKDVDYLRKMKKGEKLEIKNETIFAYPYQVIFLPRGSFSGDRNKIKIFPPNPEDFPEELKNTAYGQAMMKYIAAKKADFIATKVMRSERDVEDKLLFRTGGKNRFLETLKIDDALYKDAMKKFIDKADTKKSDGVGYNPTYQPGR
jgi:hypothetical protein